MLSTKTVLAVQLFCLCSFLACTNDVPPPPAAANAGHAAPAVAPAGSAAPAIPSTPRQSAPVVATPPAKPAASGGRQALGAAGVPAASAGSGPSTGAAGRAGAGSTGGAGGAAGDPGESEDDPFGLGGLGADASTPPPAGMCENLGCFDIFDCAIFHPDEAAVCNFTDCVDFVCKQ
jgi:hypothetical protein